MSVLQVNWKPDRSQLRGFGLISTVAFAALAALLYFNGGIGLMKAGPDMAPTVAAILAGVAAVCLLLALGAPAGLRPLYVFLTAVSLPIGWVVSHAVMAVVYYGVLTPTGLVFRLIGRDAMCRSFDPQAATYWSPRARVADAKRYFRQF